MKKNKHFITLALVAMFGVIAAVVGTTAAWFTSTASATGTITTGQITTKIKVGSEEFTGTSSNTISFTNGTLMPGDTFCGAIKIMANCSDTTRGVYVRISVSITGNGAAALSFTKGSNWTAETDGWYYYSSTASTTALTAIKTGTSNTTYTDFCGAISLSSSTGNTYQNKTCTITITLQAVQAANQSAATTTGTASTWPA